ncbi:BRO-C [Olene mendosa nucleopolyhedrovirus]|uniref:BRO-C n=1 Tax=Olene mendosa nucleopolyhedrovirus TaxID=2933796 RepID=A0AAX3AU01_9ABAC|nr:BRO-C [Olene mendosa nucleopolyhedrovirus]UOQ18846.1 BRO-C [Olene mendosa nucleopolyhedrovirus]
MSGEKDANVIFCLKKKFYKRSCKPKWKTTWEEINGAINRRPLATSSIQSQTLCRERAPRQGQHFSHLQLPPAVHCAPDFRVDRSCACAHNIIDNFCT